MILILLGIFLLSFIIEPRPSYAQFKPIFEIPEVKVATNEASASPSAEKQKELEKLKEEDLTKPEEEKAKKEFLALFSKRQINELGFTNFMGFFVQYAVRSGVPANTIILILLLPFLATVVVFVRNILGFPTLEMLVPIALAITLIATGPIAGVVLYILRGTKSATGQQKRRAVRLNRGFYINPATFPSQNTNTTLR